MLILLDTIKDSERLIQNTFISTIIVKIREQAINETILNRISEIIQEWTSKKKPLKKKKKRRRFYPLRSQKYSATQPSGYNKFA